MNNTNNKNNFNTMSIIWVVSVLLSFVCGVMGAYLVTSGLDVNKNIKAMLTSELIETSVESSADKVYNNIISNITPSGMIDNSINSSVDKVYDKTIAVLAFSKGKHVSTGTGFVYKIDKNKAYIMTNNHVVADADTVKVELNDNNNRYDAIIVGGDVYSDIAVLTVDSKYLSESVEIGNSDALKLGDTIFTVGTPLGINYKGSVTKGVVSGLDRLVEVSLSSNTNDYFMKVIQLDAAVSPGNSGGPLCNVNGQVVGIITLKIVEDEVEGMGFAIPIEDAIEYAETIEEGGKITRPYIGVSMVDLTQKDYLAQNNISIPDNIKKGIVVVDVVDGSPASIAKLQKGDIIVSLAGVEVGVVSEFRYELYKHKAGELVEFVIYRNGQKMSIVVTLGKSE